MQDNLNAVHYLIGVLREKLRRNTDSFPAIFVLQLSLLLKAMSLVMQTVSDEPQSVKVKLDEVMRLANEILKNWIESVVGGKMFGKEVCSTLSYNAKLGKLKEEFDVS